MRFVFMTTEFAEIALRFVANCGNISFIVSYENSWSIYDFFFF